jgi:hypothetical protein
MFLAIVQRDTMHEKKEHYNFVTHTPFKNAEIASEFLKGYIDRDGLMVGPTAYYGTVGPIEHDIAIVDDFYNRGKATSVFFLPSEQILVDEPTPIMVGVDGNEPPPTSVFLPGRWMQPKTHNDAWKEKELADVGVPSTTFFVSPATAVHIPIATTTNDALSRFNNTRMIPFGKLLPVESNEKHPSVLTGYFFEKSYVDSYVRPDTSSGFFVERHPFPHYVFAANKDTSLVVTLGLQSPEGLYLTAFKIPYGNVLFLPGNTIHNDIFSTGEIGISVDASETEADSAFLRHTDGTNLQLFLGPPPPKNMSGNNVRRRRTQRRQRRR